MNHILVPIDFSDDSVNALEHAILLANTMGSNIRLIHVKRQNADYDPSINLIDFDEVLLSGIEENFEKLVANYEHKVIGELDYRIREGRVYTEICNQAKYGDASMIIMGTHGVTGFEERWIGSNAFRVVNHASCPVLTIRYNFPCRVIKRIVLPIDISKETRQKVPFVAKLAQIFEAEIHLIDVREKNSTATRKILDEYVLQITNYLKRRKIAFIHDSIKVTNLPEAVIEYAVLCDADLIAIMNERFDLGRQLWVSTYAQQMVNHSPIPIISFQPKEH